ncbi:hypothetical protein [uncultured Shimia sp.]|uniref:hypothetical protein n=1 Tax=uncultured Shimia sp. TaxID=573152 RepID=UPI0026298E64|nr:hypothetical protein [uncultured Shimia sp.]
MTSITRKIGANRGKPRLWLEGKVLVSAGLDHGNRWNLVPVEGGLDLVRSDDGKRKIAGKPGRPIIDLAGASVPWPTGTVVTLTFKQGKGVIHVR